MSKKKSKSNFGNVTKLISELAPLPDQTKEKQADTNVSGTNPTKSSDKSGYDTNIIEPEESKKILDQVEQAINQDAQNDATVKVTQETLLCVRAEGEEPTVKAIGISQIEETPAVKTAEPALPIEQSTPSQPEAQGQEPPPSPEEPAVKAASRTRVRAPRRGTAIDSKADFRYIGIILSVLFLSFIVLTRYIVNINKPTIGKFDASDSNKMYYALSIENNTDKNHKIGLQLSLFNKSIEPVKLRFPAQQAALDFIAQRKVSMFFFDVPLEVWRFSSRDKRYVNNETRELVVMPGEEIIFRGEWDRKDNDGVEVSPDRYTLTGYINTTSGATELQLNR